MFNELKLMKIDTGKIYLQCYAKVSNLKTVQKLKNVIERQKIAL